MRTTIDLEYDTLFAAKDIARAEKTSLGKVISRLVRQALTGGAAPQSTISLPATATGFVPFESRGVVVSNELINRLRDAEGV
jgi:hypothetical protein